MASGLVELEDVPQWVPGTLTLDSGSLGWKGVRVREFRYPGLTVVAPGMQDFLLIVYKSGSATMSRSCAGAAWQREQIGPGSVSLLTGAARSEWHWSDPIEVCHVYLSPSELLNVASDMYGQTITNVTLQDLLKIENGALSSIGAALADEARVGGLGGHLYAEALRNQAAILLLRQYADIDLPAHRSVGGLSQSRRRRLVDYVEDNLAHEISLRDLAEIAQLSVFHFSRMFQRTFGERPHAYVMRQRLEYAKRQLANRAIPLKAVAANGGFSDQSHMNRLFRKWLDLTPGEYRKSLEN